MSTTQMELHEWTAAPSESCRAEREEAIARVEARNCHGPIDRALEAIKAKLAAMADAELVTSCTLLPDLDAFGFSDPRAMGALMRRAAKAGWIQATPNHRPSRRPGNHCRPTRIYLNTYHRAPK